jgi:hypothetical protein
MEMLSVSVRQFRFVCVVALLSLALTQLPGLGLISFSEGVTNARMWRYFDALAPGWVIWVYAIVLWPLLLVSFIGMLNFWPSARWCLIAVVLGGLLMRPFLGLSVYSPYEAVLGTVFGFSCAWLLTISFWTPLANRFTATPGGSIVP